MSPPPGTLGHFLAQFDPGERGAADAIISGGADGAAITRVSYAELGARAAALARSFEHEGVRPGDRIAVSLPNSVEFVLCYLASIFAGATIVPVNQALPERDRAYILDRVAPRMRIESVDAVRTALASISSMNSGMGILPMHARPDSIAAIFFTSGTTNRPKGVCHTLEGMLANVAAFNRLVGLDRETRMLHVMPMGYMAGFLNTILSPLVAGGAVLLAPQFDAARAISFWTPAREMGANAVWLTPTMAALLARLNRGDDVPRWTRASLRHVFVGTAPLLEAVQTAFEGTFGVRCLESYGMTEVLLVSSNTPRAAAKRGSVGRLLDGVEVVARDEAGALWVRTPFALRGYLGELGQPPVSPLEDGWMPTGDIGHVDAERDLFITGRQKDLIIHGGTNVSPRAVEEVLLEHPRVMDAAVIGRPHPFWGEEVVAYWIARDGAVAESAAAELLAFCRERLPPDAVPAQFVRLAEFPRTSTGKVQKHLLTVGESR